jgi:phosphoesterase RecJ-like protein
MPRLSTSDMLAARTRALEALRGHERFLLIGHVRPDGDCLGSQTALARVLQALGKQVHVVNPDPIQPQFDYLAKECDFRAYTGGALPEHDVGVLLDFCELERCGPMSEPLRKAPSSKMIIDHHLFHGDPWWDDAYVDVSASATGLLVRRIARELGVELDRGAALGVFTSIVTDTGWFKYSNTDAETLALAAELVEHGVQPAALFGSIYQRNDPSQPLAIARVLQRLEYFDGNRVAIVDLPEARENEAELSDSDEVLDILRAVRGVEVVLFLRETSDGKCKLSARSKGTRDVNALARRFGGGGHAKASGATLPGPLAAARKSLVEAALALWPPADGPRR